jgi:outer membrane protein assembly factor BamB
MEPPSGMRELRYGTCRVAGCAWLAFLAAGGVPAAFGGEGWMRFRGPNGSGVSEDRGLPLQWTATRNVVWKTELPGAGTSSPIVVGGRVYLTCFSGYGVPGRPGGSMNLLKRSLVCLGRKDGAIR